MQVLPFSGFNCRDEKKSIFDSIAVVLLCNGRIRAGREAHAELFLDSGRTVLRIGEQCQ
jgi:hypothetical protein